MNGNKCYQLPSPAGQCRHADRLFGPAVCYRDHGNFSGCFGLEEHSRSYCVSSVTDTAKCSSPVTQTPSALSVSHHSLPLQDHNCARLIFAHFPHSLLHFIIRTLLSCLSLEPWTIRDWDYPRLRLSETIQDWEYPNYRRLSEIGLSKIETIWDYPRLRVSKLLLKNQMCVFKILQYLP